MTVTTRYPSWSEASKAAIGLGVTSRVEYLAAYDEDPRLPASPELAYRDVWSARGGWYGFLNKKPPRLYSDWRQAQAACVRLGITSSVQYRTKQKLDPRLPSRPELKYAQVWDAIGRWPGFLARGSTDMASHEKKAA